MKLRLENNIVKIRLTYNEIDRLSTENIISEELQVTSTNKFSYAIHLVNDKEKCSLDFENNSLKVCVPNTKANKWIKSNQIGIRETIESESGGNIILIVEEDLPPRKKKNIK